MDSTFLARRDEAGQFAPILSNRALGTDVHSNDLWSDLLQAARMTAPSIGSR